MTTPRAAITAPAPVPVPAPSVPRASRVRPQLRALVIAVVAMTVVAAALRGTWLAAYHRADFVYLTPRGSPSIPTSGPAQRYLLAHFRRLAVSGLGGALYARDRGR